MDTNIPIIIKCDLNTVQVFVTDDVVKKMNLRTIEEGKIVVLYFDNNCWVISSLNERCNLCGGVDNLSCTFLNGILESYRNISSSTDFINKLDKDSKHYFCLHDPKDTYRVYHSPKDSNTVRVSYLGSIDGELNYNFRKELYEDIMFKQYKVNSLDELRNILSELNVNDIEGVIGYSSELKRVIIFQTDETYKRITVRGDFEPDIIRRYVQIRMDPEYRRIYYSIYKPLPEIIDKFESLENNIYDTAVNLYRSYIMKFVKRENVRLHRPEFLFLDECHKEYRMSGHRDKISVEKIITKLNNYQPNLLLNFITDFKHIDYNQQQPQQHPQQQPRQQPKERLIKPRAVISQ